MRSVLCSILFVVAVVTCGCGVNEKYDDSEARGLLKKARCCLSEGDYVSARECVVAIRSRHRRAVQVRREALVLVDSINLVEARHEAALAKARMGQLKATVDSLASDGLGETEEPLRSLTWRLDTLRMANERWHQKVRFCERKLQKY